MKRTLAVTVTALSLAVAGAASAQAATQTTGASTGKVTVSPLNVTKKIDK